MTKDLSKCLPALLAAKMKANSARSPFILQVHYDNAAVRRRRGWFRYLFDGGTDNIRRPSDVLQSVVVHANSRCVCVRPEGLLAGVAAKQRIDSQQAAD